MRPIDTIRQSIDSDLLKYHGSTLCQIESDDHVKDIRGIGLCAMVSPINILDDRDPVILSQSKKFLVTIVNRTKGWFDSNISRKFLVMVLTPVGDKPTLALGYLVPVKALSDLEIFKNSVDNMVTTDTKGKSIESHTKELTPDGKSS